MRTPAPPGPPRTRVPVLPPAGSQASGPADDLMSTSLSGFVDNAHFTDENADEAQKDGTTGSGCPSWR